MWQVPEGWVSHFVPVTGSTNDDAKEAIRVGCPDRSVFLADAQLRGRGRLGRSWLAPAGSSLLFSIVLRRPLPPIVLTAASSISVAMAVGLVASLTARVKWPNDVMVADRKVCGILTEVVRDRGGECAVIGIGLNVNLDPVDAGLPSTATSLAAEAGRTFPLHVLLSAILTRLDAYLAMDDARLTRRVWDCWQQLLWRRYQTIRLDQGGATIWGVVEGLGPSGCLRIRKPDGTIGEYATGDVTAP